MAENKRILLIDDEQDIRAALSVQLTDAGYEAIQAEDGLTGLDKARNQRPDLIILELMLPRLNGFKVCRLLKFDETYKHIPIIFLSARTDQDDIDLGMEVGADLYITKPFEFDSLAEQIRTQLGIINLI